MLRKFGLLSVVLLLVSQLSACGFHLRGMDSAGALPFASVQMQLDPGVKREVSVALKRELVQAGVEVVDSAPAKVQLHLAVTGYKSSRTTASGLGDATSELIKMSQAYKVVDPVSLATLTSGTASVYRDRQIKSSAALASDSELRAIQKSMSRELARQIVDRIQRSLGAEK